MATKLTRSTQAQASNQRLSAHRRGYDRKWQAARLHHLAEHPMCAACATRGCVTVATDVDHIVPHRGDRRLFWSRENWQSLCHECHSRKTQQGN
jgi:5-methylcytosine-specific restriction protein A